MPSPIEWQRASSLGGRRSLTDEVEKKRFPPNCNYQPLFHLISHRIAPRSAMPASPHRGSHATAFAFPSYFVPPVTGVWMVAAPAVFSSAGKTCGVFYRDARGALRYYGAKSLLSFPLLRVSAHKREGLTGAFGAALSIAAELSWSRACRGAAR